MSTEHSHVAAGTGNERALLIALALTSCFLIAEVIGGFITGSLALISDAAHMFTDSAALAIALVAIKVGKRLANKKRTFGYYRFEILAAAVNAILLFAVAIYIIFEAYQRFKNPPEIQSMGMLAIAIAGLCINLISMRILSGGKDNSINMKGAYLEVWSDMLGSIGVIVGALVIGWTGWSWVDSVIAVAIGLWVLPRTWKLLSDSLNILLEGVPEGTDLTAIEQATLALPGVKSIHDLHVWAISSGKVSLTMHVISEENANVLLKAIQLMLIEKFEIHHTTIQLEQQACTQASEVHSFG
ncbi:Cobalt-zinc-cadmium resistance protein CzcD [Herminiimonas arsenicoxydans]|uniref:Cobalt-zinc-cadmium resistance protein CzcD n=1 Tax=Herminiimonas arsenicoxydans TaxID=204773 RepID=A4G2J9_HERAR|nr:Cobalt-zinc-cadmium resistance protein CzcD [Herminiimonas arsenicoxydans]